MSILDQTSIGISMSYINSLISQSIQSQRQPISILRSQKDQLAVRIALYKEIKSKLSDLRTIIDGLKTGDSDVFKKVTANSSNSAILTATATPEAAKAMYTISISSLAQSHRVRSDEQTGTVNLTGRFSLNGTEITVSNASLENIRDAINNAKFGTDKKLIASIVKNTLFIDALSTGAENQITFDDSDGILLSLGILKDTDSDGRGDAFKNELQSASDANFTVNGIPMTSAKNKGVVIEGVSGLTLDLLSKTEGENTVTVTVEPDYTAIRAKINAFVNTFNEIVKYLKERNTTTVDQKNKTYSRGSLVGETLFSTLRTNLITTVRQDALFSLFEITSNVETLKSELDAGTVSETLRNEFLNSGIQLSPEPNIVVLTLQAGSKWRLTDKATGRVYYVLAGEGKLSVSEAKNLSAYGFTFNSDMTISVETDKLNTALETELASVAKTFDMIMTNLASNLEPYTTTVSDKNTLELYINSINTKSKNIDSRIERLEKELSRKEELLKKQYTMLYTQNIQLSMQQFTALGIYGSINMRI